MVEYDETPGFSRLLAKDARIAFIASPIADMVLPTLQSARIAL